MTTVRTKKIAAVLIVGLSGLLTFLVIRLAVQQAVSATAAGIVALLFASILACAYVMLSEWRKDRYLITGLVAITALLVGALSITALIGSLLLFMFLSGGAYLIATATRENITFKLQKIFLPGLRMIVTGIAVMVVVLVLPVVREYVAGGGASVSTGTVEYLSAPAAPLIENFIPGYSTNQTINEIIDVQIQEQYASLGVAAEVPPQQRTLAVRDLSQALGVPLTGTERAPEVLAAVINSYIQQISEVDGILVTVILAGIGLLAIRAIVPILAWMALAVTALLFLLIKRLGLVRLEKQQLPVDRLIL